ncbi:MAG TPA: WD40 repeat domain-containing protein [Chthoniobacterales bacterium]|nr:WD40 repeat domain-containing protein [Chthoniobacterales bacterium]
MKKNSISFLAALAAIFLPGVPLALAQESPAVLWEFPTPNGLANSIVGVGWAPGSVGQVAMGSNDRWLRTRRADTGQVQYSILGPQHSRGGDQTLYSTDGLFLAVHHSAVGLNYRVYRVADGLWLGTILVTFSENGLVQFTPDAQLQNSVPPDGTINRWRFEEFTVVSTTGSGYAVATTTINFSPKAAYQAVASGGTINIQSRRSGKLVGTFPGGPARGSTVMRFTPDGTALAVWDGDSNATRLLSIPDGNLLRVFPDAVTNEGIGAIRFSPDGASLVTTGYLPFETSNGWEQKGIVRFWRVSDGAMRHQFDQHTGIGVTSAIAWSPDASQFIYGTYEGAVVAALTPAP